MITRRLVIKGMAGLGGALTSLSLLDLLRIRASAASWEKPGDMALGSPDAPVTVIEYFSLTCPHCRAFHAETYPEFKANYVDTGKVRFVARDFPLNRPALHAAMLAHCAGPDHYFAFVDALFDNFDSWTRSANYLDALSGIAQLGGVSDEKFRSCINDQELETQVLNSILEAQEDYDVGSTPTFIINGKKYEGGMRFSAFAEILDRLLPET